MKEINDFLEGAIDLKELLHVYKLTHPIPPDYKKHVIAHKGKSYKKLLKTMGGYNVLSGALIAIWFFLKKHGLNAVLTKLFFVALVSTSVSSGVYYVYETMAHKDDLSSIKGTEMITAKSVDEVHGKLKQNKALLTFSGVTTGSMDVSLVRKIEGHFYSSLSNVLGNKIIYAKNRQTAHVMFVSVERVGEIYVLFLKIVNRNNSSILMVEKEKIYNLQRLDSTIEKLVHKANSVVQGPDFSPSRID